MELTRLIRLLAVLTVILLTVGTGLSCLAASNSAGVLLKEQDVKTAVEKMVQQKCSGLGWDVRLRSLKMPDQVRIPAGQLDLEVVAPQRWEGWGKVSLGLLVRVNDRLEKNLTVHADVEALTEMVVTTRQLQSGSVLEAGDLAIQKREVTSANSKFSKNVDEVIGKKLRQTIRENSPVRTDQLEKVPVIRTGQLITIIAESSNIRISVSGRAKGSGAVGDQIMVQNLTSLKDIPAIIIDANTVAVGF